MYQMGLLEVIKGFGLMRKFSSHPLDEEEYLCYVSCLRAIRAINETIYKPESKSNGNEEDETSSDEEGSGRPV